MMKIHTIRDIYSYKDFFDSCEIVIWGAGEWGNDLRAELRFYGYDPYTYDTNSEKGYGIKKFISYECMVSLSLESKLIILVSIKDYGVVMKEIIPLIERDMPSSTYVFHYPILELEELAALRNGYFFNGLNYVKLMDGEESRDLLRRYIQRREPFLYSRYGGIESRTMFYGLAGAEVGPDLRFSLKNNAGFFPANDQEINKFREIVKKSARAIDIMCVYQTFRWIEYLYREFSPKAVLMTSQSSRPFFEESCWTNTLEGMNVLVIHPFAKLIKKQYEESREQLFHNSLVLPKFNLIVYEAVQSMGGNKKYKDWFEALNVMKQDISEYKFDIALIGCGAYGMPLGAYVKNDLKRMAIHMGGTLQLLFGIKGKRWDAQDYQYDKLLYNEFWVRPGDELKPDNYKCVEGGCYW